MSSETLSGADLHAVLQAVASDVQLHVDELRELDAALGDGDLGVTMQLACGAMAEPMGDAECEDVGAMLASIGMRINRVSPSTFGTLLASAFLGAGATMRGDTAVSVEDLGVVGSGAVDGVAKRGKAEVGDKTMLDALVPAVEAFKAEIAGQTGAPRAFEAAAQASEGGAQATAAMRAKHGRASWRRDESIGLRDAGAVALNYVIQSFAYHAARRVASRDA